jgi:gas vesicle protein
MRSGNFLWGLVAGAAAGAILGVLFAPDKGTDTRQKIAKKSGEYADAIKGKFNDYLHTIAKKIEDSQREMVENTEQNQQFKRS